VIQDEKRREEKITFLCQDSLTPNPPLLTKIHLSTRYAQKVIKQDPDQAKRELEGTIINEMVHCFQLDLQGRCDSGLIEGIADWVRMKSGFGAKHWNENNIGTR